MNGHGLTRTGWKHPQEIGSNAVADTNHRFFLVQPGLCSSMRYPLVQAQRVVEDEMHIRQTALAQNPITRQQARQHQVWSALRYTHDEAV